MSSGGSLRATCRDADPPPEGSVRGGVRDNRDGFAARYREARAMLVEHGADQIIELADDETIEPNARRIRVDSRKWLMSKPAPHRYGDRLVSSGGPRRPTGLLPASRG